MPTYEYRCPEGHDFEKFVQKMSDARGELPCPSCGAVAPRRLSAGGGLLFKGSGFYITDYGKDGKKDQRAAAKAESTGSGSSDSKSSSVDAKGASGESKSGGSDGAGGAGSPGASSASGTSSSSGSSSSSNSSNSSGSAGVKPTTQSQPAKSSAPKKGSSE